MPVPATCGRIVRQVRQHLDRIRWAADWASVYWLYRSSPGRHVLHTRFRGRRFAVHVRGGTLDAQIALQVLREDSEYRLPVPLDPRVIFDVGAHIGTAAVYFAAVYPNARIYCFEPLPQNVQLLRLNTACFGDRVTVVPKGLGAAEDSVPYRLSNDPRNFGGGTFHQVGAGDGTPLQLPVTTVAQVCRELRIDRVDVFKIDAEGAELSVIRGTPLHLLADTSVFIGELHGVDDWSFCDRLGRTHAIGIEKRYDTRCHPFVAVRKDLATASGNQSHRRAA